MRGGAHPRNLLAGASVAAIAGVVLVAAPLGPMSARRWLLAAAILAIIVGAQAALSDPKDLKTALLLALLPVVALIADGSPTWLIGPLAALLMVAAELNALGWEAQATDGISAIQRQRLWSAGIMAALGAGAGLALAALGLLVGPAS